MSHSLRRRCPEFRQRSLLMLVLLTSAAVAPAVDNLVIAAGGGIDSGTGIPATAARMASPDCVIFDAANNLFIVDQNNNRICKVTKTTGILTVVAGVGTYGFSGDGGAATAAQLAKPSGIALDGNGDLLIADQYNHRIRKVTLANGIISTIAGSGASFEAFYGTQTGDGGPATDATLNQPESLVVATNGDIYFSDMMNQRICMIHAGVISTIAGSSAVHTTPAMVVGGFSGDNGPAFNARFQIPLGLALDAAGNLLVVDCQNDRIRMIAADVSRTITTVVGNGNLPHNPLAVGDGGSATTAQLYRPTGLALDAAGNLLIADQGNQRIRRVDHSSGVFTTISTIAGTGVAGFAGNGGPATAAQLNLPTGVGVDQAGHVFITERNLNAVREITTQTMPAITWFGHSLEYGTALGAIQLDATATVPGSFVYTPPAGTVLPAGTRLITVTFIASELQFVSVSKVTGMTVTPAPLVLVAEDQQRAQGSADPLFSWHLTGLRNGDTANVLNGSPVLTTSATVASAAGTYPITPDLSAVTVANYTLTATPATLTIVRTQPVISWAPQPLVYGSPLGASQLAATTTMPGTFVYAPAAGALLPLGTTLVTVTFTPDDQVRYASASATANVSVDPAPLMVVADNLQRAQGTNNPTLTWHLSGLVAGDTAAVLSGGPSLSTTALVTSAAGDYPIVVDVTAVTATNYSVSAVPGTLTVVTAAGPTTGGPSSGGGGGCGLGSGAAAASMGLIGLLFLLLLRARGHSVA